MNFSSILSSPADWMTEAGPQGDIVVTSRVRLARNVDTSGFPGWAKKPERSQLLEKLLPRIETLPEMSDAFAEELKDLTAIQKQVLVERHLISREHAAKSTGSAAIMNATQTLSIMVNEEDHLRMQAILPGLQLQAAHRLVDGVDSNLESQVNYAFDDRWGYLTACPTNLGTGMRASCMLHLPALVISEQVNQVIQAVNKIGLAVRGLYGEGTEALANLFQISNQSTLGESEAEIIAKLQKVINQIITHEQNARQKLLEDKLAILQDQIGRAYAVLRYAHIIQSKEALNLLSMVRLGIDLEFFPKEEQKLVDRLLMEIQPAHLQTEARRKLGAEERDLMRSEILRRKLKTLPAPRISDDSNGNGHSPDVAGLS
ncbi:MAG: protein arginine kinase [Verrucomicrobiota bacterium]